MVKHLLSSRVEEVKSPKKEKLENFLNNIIQELSLEKIPSFSKGLILYFELQTSSQTVKNAYSILAICLSLQHFLEKVMPCTEFKTMITRLFTQVFERHRACENISSSSIVFKQIQNLLNIISKKSLEVLNKSNYIPQIPLILQLLSIYPNINFENIFILLTKISVEPKNTSIFSYFSAEKPPFFPKILCKKNSLVLDLDETLGHWTSGVFKPRPGVSKFLREMSKKFELILYTASTEYYANCAMSVVDPSGLVYLRLYRQHLCFINEKIFKDLRVIGRDIEGLIVIENQPKNFVNQESNVIPIKSWYGDDDDCELEKMCEFFNEIEADKCLVAREVVKKALELFSYTKME